MNELLSATVENYLLTIYNLEKEKKVARPKDICLRQNVAKSTVTAALQCLASKGLLNYQPYEPVTLTASGLKRAKQLFLRKKVLFDFLNNIMLLPGELADETSDTMVHSMNPQVLRRFVCFITLFKENLRDGAGFMPEFRQFIEQNGHAADCNDCLEKYASLIKL